jgi:threonine dehydratase
LKQQTNQQQQKILNEQNMNKIDVNSAYEKIAPFINRTPLERCRFLSQNFDSHIYFKFENWQKTGSFKIRGALNKMLSLTEGEKAKGVITASAGNHGLGVAYAAEVLDLKARIVLPTNASEAKIKILSTFGCEIIKAGKDYDEAEDIAHQIEKDCDLAFVHAFDDPVIISGQGTVAKEMIAQVEHLDMVIVPIGGGGLLGGVASYIKSVNPDIKIIGVQSEASPAMQAALNAGKVIETPIDDTLADGLAGRFVSDLTLELTNKYVDDVILVEEQAIRNAIRFMIQDAHIIIEGSAAVGIAAIISEKLDVENKKVCVILTGRNISSAIIASILNN